MRPTEAQAYPGMPGYGYRARMSSDTDDRAARLAALMYALQAHEFRAEVADDVLRVTSPERPAHEVQVRCAPRASDGGELWFESGGEPLGGAWQITETLTAIKGLTAVRM